MSIVEGEIQGGSFETRENLHQISIDSFYSDPLFGGGKVGGHSQVFDLLGSVGLVGFTPFFLMIWSCFKTYLNMIPRGLARTFMIITFMVPCLFLYHKGIFGATGWLFTFVIAPSLVKAISDISKTNFKMNDKNKAPFKVEDVNWDELSGIGILKDELEQAGELETLLRGEKTGVVSLSLVLLGVDVVMDATLQLVRKNDSPLLEIIGINPTQ